MKTKRITNIEIKKRNRNRIYCYMREAGSVSNPDIAYELKLSLPTVTQNTKELIEMGLIEECGEFQSTGGRKAKALTVISNAKYAVGLDITKNHVGFILTNLTGKILKYRREVHTFENSDTYYQKINERLEAFLSDARIEQERILGIGVSIPGIVDLENMQITESHALNIKKVSFQNIEKIFSYPCDFMNDANAGAFAEGMVNKKKFFYLSLSNTVGGGFFDGENMMYGAHYRFGEIGHMTIVPDGEPCYCGQRGCMDSYCNAKKLAKCAGGKLEDFFVELQKGNETYKKIWESYLQDLAIAVNNIHMILDCDIVLGGYVGSYMEAYIEQIREKVLERNTFHEYGGYIKTCNYKVEAAAYGAAMHVIEKYIAEI